MKSTIDTWRVSVSNEMSKTFIVAEVMIEVFFFYDGKDRILETLFAVTRERRIRLLDPDRRWISDIRYSMT